MSMSPSNRLVPVSTKRAYAFPADPLDIVGAPDMYTVEAIVNVSVIVNVGFAILIIEALVADDGTVSAFPASSKAKRAVLVADVVRAP